MVAVAVLEAALADAEVGGHREGVGQRRRPAGGAGGVEAGDVELGRIRRGVPQERGEMAVRLGGEAA